MGFGCLVFLRFRAQGVGCFGFMFTVVEGCSGFASRMP